MQRSVARLSLSLSLPNTPFSDALVKRVSLNHTVRHPRCVFINYNWINQLSNTAIWWLDICCLLHRYQLHVSALMAIFRLID